MPKQKTIAAVGVIFDGLTSLVDYLQQRNIVVETYGNVKKGLEKLAFTEYALVLLGLPMRGEVTPMTALERMRKTDSMNRKTLAYVLHYDTVVSGSSHELITILGSNDPSLYFKKYNAEYVNLTTSGSTDMLAKEFLQKLHGSNNYLQLSAFRRES